MNVDIERDDKFRKQEVELFSQMREIVGTEATSQPIKTNRLLPSDNKMVSVEDALKELADLHKQGLL